MAKRIYQVASAVLGALIGSACGGDTTGGGTAGTGGTGATAGTGGTGATAGTGGEGLTAEYGMPSARFIVSGTVVAETGDTPIEGIEVRLDEAYESTTSDVNGDFTIDATGFAFCTASPCDANVTATDLDGEANGGSFETTTVAISLDQTEPGSGTWDDGTWEASEVDVAMPLEAAGGGGAGGGTAGAGGS